jgi:hypothetical protein
VVESRPRDRGSVILYLKPAGKHAGAVAEFPVLPLLDDLARGERQFVFAGWAALQKSLTAVYRLDRHADIYADPDSGEISKITLSGVDTPDHARLFCQIQP